MCAIYMYSNTASMLQIYYFCFSFLYLMAVKINWDFMGIATSVACAIHCAVLPVLISTLPVFGINIIHNSFFEWGMIGLACIVGYYSLLHGYMRHHKSFIPVMIFSAGMLFLILKQLYISYEYLLLGFAVIFIISSHLFNYNYCRKSKASGSSHHQYQ